MAGKARRQLLIQDIVASGVVTTQEELARALRERGVNVTQATISRDIKELKLVKVPSGDGRYRYASPATADGQPDSRILRIFRECVTGYEASENIVVIQTLPATAPGVAEAVDQLNAEEVIGTLAGERTVFVVIRPKSKTPRFLERLRDLVR